jgi:hypothetical protein
MSAAEKYNVKLGEALAKEFDSSFKFYRSRLELRRNSIEGHDSIVLSGSHKFSPHISVRFYFGVNFAKARLAEKEIFGDANPAYYHIHQYSINRNHMIGLDYKGPFTWNINIQDPPDILEEVKKAIEGMALPFFKRFSNLRDARDAKAKRDSWCLSGDLFWHHILAMDMALNDMAHFNEWKKTIKPFYAKQAEKKILGLKLENA